MKKYMPPAMQSRPTPEVYRPQPADNVFLPLGISSDLSSKVTLDSGVCEPGSPISTYRLSTNDTELNSPSPKHRANLEKWYENKKLKMLSQSNDEETDSGGDDTRDTYTYATEYTRASSDEDDNRVTRDGTLQEEKNQTKQPVATLAITLTIGQLLLLMLQLAMCGIASLDINPMIGPFPDAFSQWGGKNPYLMLHDNEWWRLITPSFLHVGLLHFVANAFCQLEAIALFEREWGSFRWLLVYIVSSVGCNVFSSYFDPDTIAVGSSGALMGLYAAKLSQVSTTACFDTRFSHIDDAIRLDHLSSVLCGLTLVSVMSSFTYIDWSGHMGGLVSGFSAGMVLFSAPIRGCCGRFLWSLIGLLGLVSATGSILYYFILTGAPDDELADACEYFRGLFPEGYQCGCMWSI